MHKDINNILFINKLEKEIKNYLYKKNINIYFSIDINYNYLRVIISDKEFKEKIISDNEYTRNEEYDIIKLLDAKTFKKKYINICTERHKEFETKIKLEKIVDYFSNKYILKKFIRVRMTLIGYSYILMFLDSNDNTLLKRAILNCSSLNVKKMINSIKLDLIGRLSLNVIMKNSNIREQRYIIDNLLSGKYNKKYYIKFFNDKLDLVDEKLKDFVTSKIMVLKMSK